MTRIIIAGPGRAGVALGLASVAAGHDVVGVTARTTDAAVEAATVLNAYALAWGDQLPGADLLIVAVRDDAIADVAAHLAPLAADVAAAVHLSGLKSVAALEPLAVAGLDVGFDPSSPDAADSAGRGGAVARRVRRDNGR